jgi:hypothetical protein
VRILALVSLLLTVACVLVIAAAAIGQEEVETVPTETVPSETTPTQDEDVPDEEEFGREFEERAQPDPARPKEEVPPLLPMTPVVRTAASTATLPRTGGSEPVLIAAAYWLLLGGLTLRRVTQSCNEQC